MAYKLTWLADVLRKAGLNVIEVEGWQGRGQGDMGVVKGVLCHHTVGPRKGNMPSLDVLVNGRGGPKPLKGPLCQLGLARDGTYYVIAAGKGSHAGKGKWVGVTAGNSQLIGIEAENTGVANDQPWPPVQMQAYARGCAAILDYLDQPTIMAVGHKEYCIPKGRKIDPSFDMGEFRNEVEAWRGVREKMAEVPEVVDTADDGRRFLRVVGVAPESLNFRAGPSLSSDRKGELFEGTVVEVIDEGPNWTKVKTGQGFIGWVGSKYLTGVN